MSELTSAFFRPREGESGEAPPVAEEASRFRGSAPVCGREATGNRKRRDGGAGCIAILDAELVAIDGNVAVPVRGAGCIDEFHYWNTLLSLLPSP